jgi:hypothetical protein
MENSFELRSLEFSRYPTTPSRGPDIFATTEYYKEKLLYIYYKFIRPNGEHNMLHFTKMYDELLCSLKSELDKQDELYDHCAIEKQAHKNILQMLYKLIAQTRDICYGKGERDITYMMIYKWWKYYPHLGLIALYPMMFSGEQIKLVQNGFKTYIDTDSTRLYIPHQNSYGCFKDVKYFCNYVRKYGDKRMMVKNNMLCKYAMTMLNQRVYDDYMEYCKNGTAPSLTGKWVPREKSKYGWIFEQMAIQWVQATDPVILSSVNLEQYENMDVNLGHIKAVIKCKIIYRKVISLLSKQLDLQETKQCQNRWAEIDPSTITIDSMLRNNNALFNIDNTFNDRKNTVIDKDRRECSHNMKEYAFFSLPHMAEMSPQLKVEKLRKSYINQSTFSPMQFVKQAISLINNKNIPSSTAVVQNVLYQIELLNDRWKKFSQKCNALDFFIPILDMSLSMSGDALYNAIGMCCLISEKSRIGQRVMVMDNIPTWVNLEECAGNFVAMVEILYRYTSRNTIGDLLKTFDIIIDSMSNSGANKMELVFVIFTNESTLCKYERGNQSLGFGRDEVSYKNEITIHSLIADRFEVAKLDIPHIIYWNCSPNIVDKDELPVSGLVKRTSIVSGTNAKLLNHFSFIGWGDLYNNTSFDTLENILSNSRYDMMGDLFEKYSGPLLAEGGIRTNS